MQELENCFNDHKLRLFLRFTYEKQWFSCVNIGATSSHNNSYLKPLDSFKKNTK
jgi:hypothetical protein